MTPLLPPLPLFQLYSTHAVHSLSPSPCLQGLSAAPQVRPSPLRNPLISTVGASSYYQLWPDVDLAVAIFQAATRRVTTGTAFDVSATLRDALCRGIVNRFRRRSTGEPRSPRRPVGRGPAHRRLRESWDPNPLMGSVRRPHVALRSSAMGFVSLHHGHTRSTLCFSHAHPLGQRALPASRGRLPSPRLSPYLYRWASWCYLLTAPIDPRRLVLPSGRPGMSSSAYGCRKTSS